VLKFLMDCDDFHPGAGDARSDHVFAFWIDPRLIAEATWRCWVKGTG
jgi:hypothetical protein